MIVMFKFDGNVYIFNSTLHILKAKGWCNTMNLDKVVCHCLGITNGMIKDAVESGAKTLEDVQEQTGATTVCGACLEDVQRLVDYFVSEQG